MGPGCFAGASNKPLFVGGRRYSRRMIAKVSCIALVGMDAWPVDVEVHVETNTLPSWHIVGLPSVGVRESQQRIRAAVVNSGEAWPNCRVTVNLAPGDLRKEGALLDLPLPMGSLAAHGRLKPEALLGPLFDAGL